MLTEAEKKWLAMRELRHFETGYYMPSFKHNGKTWYDFSVWTNWKAAAEFEARVVAKLAEGPEDCQECFWGLKGWSADNAEARLKHARLAVEQEMEKE